MIKMDQEMKLSISFCLLSIIFISALPLEIAAAEFYRWVDKNGIVHVSDSFPQAPQTKEKNGVGRIYLPGDVPRPAPDKRPPPADEYQIPFTAAPGGGMLVQGIINDYINVTMLYDTGATWVTISEGLARKLDAASPAGRTITLNTAGGRVKGRTALITKLAVGEASKENVMAVVTERDDTFTHGFDAILGLSFLQYFQATVDYKKRTIVLKRH
ncbi:MAG TPA: retroviral-like aspartic protease family protein [Syntrophales bacterium]|jgi:clan AA aspartic protease (TIGR02281 family)|nr:retroviral-like aspartic protease family protein [Syntrophales bacterium]